MGCDIHGHWEIKINGKWEHYSVDRFTRRYNLFAKLAGVRNWDYSGIVPISEPRGLPSDITVITKLDSQRDNFHSHSYIDSLEIKEVYLFMMKQIESSCDRFQFDHFEWGYLYGNGFEGFCDYPNSYPKEIEDLRRGDL